MKKQQKRQPPIVRGKEHLEHRVWPCPPSASVRAFVMRALDGNDELEASRVARTHRALDEIEAGTQVMVEQLRLSIVAVRREEGGDWETVAQPFDEFDRWTTRTRRLATLSFQELNLLSDEEVGDFRRRSEVVQPPRLALAEDDGVEEVLEA